METKASSVRILILTADAGFGHRSAAIAVAEALRLSYGASVELNIVNPLNSEWAPSILRDSQEDYDRWVKQVPELYKLAYEASDLFIPTRVMEDTLGTLLFDAIEKAFTENNPDVVLNTYPMYQAAITQFQSNLQKRVPVFTVVTDLATVHRIWFHKEVDGFLVPNHIVAKLAVSNQVPAEKVCITGIPVYPDISRESRAPDQIRAALGWETGIISILAVGSRRSKKLLDMLHIINHYGAPLQLAVVAGKNENLYSQLQQVDWHIPVHIYDFVDNMPSLMKASDLVISKAGGLIITESLACGRPLILMEIIPGQETGNAEYIKAAKAGVVVNTPLEMLESLHHLLVNNHELLKQYTQHALAIGKPESAFTIADILWHAAHGQAGCKTSSDGPDPYKGS